jgi:hypothetical protein
MTGNEFLKMEMPWPDNVQDLTSYIEEVKEKYNTSYNDAVYGPALAAIAAFNYTASQMGLSGFQASYSEMLFLEKLRNIKHGFKILNFDNLLYPQYLHDFDLSAETLIRKNLDELKKAAKEELNSSPNAAQEVRDHWTYITEIPDSERIEDD